MATTFKKQWCESGPRAVCTKAACARTVDCMDTVGSHGLTEGGACAVARVRLTCVLLSLPLLLSGRMCLAVRPSTFSRRTAWCARCFCCSGAR